MDEYDVLGGYVPSFVQHLNDTRARLGLGMASRDTTSGTGKVVDVHSPSDWTSSERDAFFRAVSAYSRWRPDLIAACIPTKTEWEIWTYLDALEEGVGALNVEGDDEDADMLNGPGEEHADVEMRTNGSGSDSDSDEDGGVCEPALEVSQTWVDAEERMAAWIVQEEHQASLAVGTEDADEEPEKRERGRPHGSGRVRGRGQALVGVVAEERTPFDACSSRSPKPSPVRKPSRKSPPVQGREVLMGQLGAPHLHVLDGILKENEAIKGRQGSVTVTTLTEHGDQVEPNVRDGVKGLIPPDPQTRNVSESFPDAVIDPILLALSESMERLSGQNPTPSALMDVPPSIGPSLKNTFMFEPGESIQTHPSPRANAEPDLTVFSPRSRRRIQKRLYMRRKRASLREGSAPSGELIGLGIEKLKPGKKAKLERMATPAESISVACSEGPSDAEVEATENVRKKNKGGLTLPYKLRAQFADLGIDAAYLGGEGMDLLNLGMLGKLMGLCTSLEHDGEDEDGSAIVQFIDAQLIRHLQAAMVTYVTDIVHRTIVRREREIRLKQRNQAWRQSDHVTIAAVERAVAAVGARYHSHKEYFKLLSVSSDPENEAAESAEDDPDIQVADLSTELPRLSPYRDVYVPLVHPPSGWRMGALSCLSRTYEREGTRTRRGPSADLEEDELISDETDEEGLEAELREEDETEVRDAELARMEEDRLWKAVGRS